MPLQQIPQFVGVMEVYIIASTVVTQYPSTEMVEQWSGGF